MAPWEEGVYDQHFAPFRRYLQTAGCDPGCWGAGIQNSGMASAAKGDQGTGLIQGILKVGRPVHGQDGRELLEGEGFIAADFIHFANDHPGPIGKFRSPPVLPNG